MRSRKRTTRPGLLLRRAFEAWALLALVACTTEPTPAPRLAIGELASPAGEGSGQPHLAVGPDDRLVMSWLEPNADASEYALKYATLDPATAQWGPPFTVARGPNWFVNSSDLPSVQPLSADLWAAHWLVSSATSQFAYDIEVATSVDGGRSWGEPQLLNDDRTDAEHGFVSLFAWGAAIGAVWLDGRDLANFHEQEPTAPEIETAPVGTNLRYARLAADGGIIDQGVIDSLACDCCPTDVAVTERGPLVAYRDRTPEEIRDIVVRRHDGSKWTEGVRVGPDNWQIEGCPVNGPAIAARGDDIAVAWFTAAADQPRVRLARSSDGGANFQAPTDVDSTGSFGQVDVLLTDDGDAIVSWWRRSASGGTQLSARRIDASGALGDIQIIASSHSSRPFDIPQMVRSGNLIVFAWTESADQSMVRTATAEL